VRPATDEGWTAEVPARLRRRDPRIWQMTHVAAARALARSPAAPRSIVSATALGALDETQAFLDALFRTGLGSPRNFMASVHNSMAGKLAIELKILGPNLTLCDGVNSLASALTAAAMLDAAAFPSLVVLSDEKTAFLRNLAPYLPASCGFLADAGWDEGAAAFVVGPDAQSRGPLLRAAGPAPVGGRSPAQACSALAQSLGAASCGAAEIDGASDSFVRPGFLLYDFVARGVSGRIPTCDPRSGSVAIIDLCV
jgi:hypothetical protein